MQFNDIFFSTYKLWFPSIISFLTGLFSLILITYIFNKYNINQQYLSKIVFSIMLVMFFSIRYYQAKNEMVAYNKRKIKKRKKREVLENN